MAENSGHGAADPAPGADSAPGGWAERIAARSGWFAVSLGLLLAAATLLTTIWAGNLAAVVDLDAPLGLDRSFRFQLVLIALISLSIWARFHETGLNTSIVPRFAVAFLTFRGHGDRRITPRTRSRPGSGSPGSSGVVDGCKTTRSIQTTPAGPPHASHGRRG